MKKQHYSMEVSRTRIEITSFVFVAVAVACLFTNTNFQLFICRWACSGAKQSNLSSQSPIGCANSNSLSWVWALKKKTHPTQIKNDSKIPTKDVDGTKERSGTESKPTLAWMVHFYLSSWSRFRCIFLISISDFSFFF